MIEVAGRPIGADNPPFVIAEMSGNHNQSLDRALHLIDAAAEAGAHAIKLQTATPEGLTLECGSDDFRINDASSPWYGRNLFELYREAVTPWEWHETLYAHARAAGLIVFSSPFELAAVDFLETLDSPCYKIASFELVDHQLIRKTAATGKPLIMSTGIATLAEIADAVNVAKSEGNEKIILLKCTSTYPASPIDSNLKTIPHLRDAFGLLVGLSDHTLGVGVPCAAVSLGACG
jgi:sialic acid synthase SpsE